MAREIITFQCTECKEPELHEHEEQEDHDRASGVEEVLPELPQAPAAQGNQVELVSEPTGSVTGTRGVGLTADQRSPKPRVGVRIPPPLPRISGQSESHGSE